ncbi:MAG TPA: signal peptidase II [Tepidisphaeraceae bacterium]|jgi:signal peptidase II|nr:signal peptidase II [Tepidisphaeraceae bacterium]
MVYAFRSPAALARFFLTAAIGVGLDLWSKSVAFATPSLALEPYRFIPGWLEFEMVKNQGAVFGFGQGQRILFVCVSIGAILFLLYLFAASGKKWVYQVLLGMLLAGVLGNLYDRVMFGYVRDMIHIFPAWPNLFRWVFNVADSLLCTGVTLMILYNMLPERREKQE